MVDARQLVGTNVRRLRLAAGLSQEDVAARMGVDRAYISSLEAGRRNPTVVTVWHAAEALGVSIKALFEEDEDARPPLTERKRAPRLKSK
ncbi:helix-turn-helix transcriptional regulator [Aquabacter cavernae]|uniref:helix-turn-helix domain-containing protein n=1 Tax=Aquabacter cavernae TaxID=2496029 RepID=UPI003084662C